MALTEGKRRSTAEKAIKGLMTHSLYVTNSTTGIQIKGFKHHDRLVRQHVELD